MAVKKTFDFFLQPLLKKFFQDMGRDPNNLEMILIRQKAGQLLKDSNKVIQFPQKESFMQQVERMKKSGDIVNLNNLKKNDNVLTREMFKNSNLNKVEPVNERFIDYTIYDIKTKEPTEGMKIVNRIIKREGEYKDLTEEQSKRILKETDDHLTGKNKPEDKANGGRIGFRAGKFVLDKVIANLLKDKKKVQQAADDIFGTGDYKMDAQMAAEALVENNPRIFKNKLYDDLDLDTQLEIYGAVLEPVQNKLSMAIKMKRASRPEKTLKSMKENKTIDMSDPEIADEFTRFMKETDPEGYKKLEQTVELSNFNPKGRKKNAKGGRIGYQEGGGIESRLEQLGGDVTSAEQLLQQINERLQSAESNLGEGAGNGIGSLPGLGPMPTTNDPASAKSMAVFGTPRQMPLDNISGIGSGNGLRAINLADIPPGTQQIAKNFDQMTPLEKLKAAQSRNMQQDVKPGPVQDYLNEVIKTKGETNMLYPNLPNRTSALPGSLQPPESYQGGMQSPLLQQQNLAKALPGLFAKGGRAGFYTGGIADVEPSLDDIGHGSDSLMARTRLMSPGNQATTSTGLNYLLAEDNDNLRVPFKVGGSGRRDFLKLLATLGGGIAGIKSGLFGMGGKEATKKAVTETVKQSTGKPPPYFFKLVDKIKTMGDDVTEKAAIKEREVVTEYKNFRLTEDVATGEKTIQRVKTDSDFNYYDENLAEETYMNYRPGKGQSDEATGPVADEYVEDTSYIRTSGPSKGEIYDTVDGVPDDVLEEIGEKKVISEKAEGGRIGFSGGKLATFLADKTITGSSRRFLEKIFGKGSLDEMLKRDPNMHRGMLEVVEMFRK